MITIVVEGDERADGLRIGNALGHGAMIPAAGGRSSVQGRPRDERPLTSRRGRRSPARMTSDPQRLGHGARRAVAALIVALLVVACAPPATSPPVPTAAPTPTASAPTPPAPTLSAPTTAPTPAVSPPFACGEPVGRPGTVSLAQISGLSVVNAAGIGRVTFTFHQAGEVAAVPEVEIRPATPPFSKDPSGLPLEVAGTAFLEIVLHGGTALDESYQPTYDGPVDFAPGGSPIVEMKRAGDFEAVSSWVVGLDGPACVRILPFDGTSRLVIEIRGS
jgi:hypothetical protein